MQKFVQLRPMVAKAAKDFADAQKSCHFGELKFDGMRLWMVRYENGDYDLLSRTLKSQKGRLPHLEKIAMALPKGTIIDGEAILFLGGKTGNLKYKGEEVSVTIPDFHDTMSVMASAPSLAVKKQKELGCWMKMMAFDMPYVAGENLSQLPLSSRRRKLQALLEKLSYRAIRLSPVIDLSKENLDRVFALGGEGIMAKRWDCKYEPGKRTSGWKKLKFVDTSDTVIMDFAPGEGRLENLFGAVVFGQYKNGKLTARGKCSGFTDAEREKMNKEREKYIGQVMEIAHMGIAKNSFRHPRFVTLRLDKMPKECLWD